MGVAGGVAAGTAVAGVAGSAISSSAQSSAAKSAAAQESAAQQAAAANDTGTLGSISSALQPYENTGLIANSVLQNQFGQDATNANYIDQANGYTQDAANIYGTLQNGISQQTLQNTPGYQFTLQQGLESTQNSAAARGLANSGAALKGAASYATGLANDTYQSQYNDLLSTAQGYNSLAGTSLSQQASLLGTNNQNFNQILAGAQLGEGASSTYGSLAASLANAASGYTAAAGQSQAAGTIGQANAVTSGVTGATSSISQGLLLQQLLQGNSGGMYGSGTQGAAGTYQFPTTGYSTGGYTTLPS